MREVLPGGAFACKYREGKKGVDSWLDCLLALFEGFTRFWMLILRKRGGLS